MTRPMEAPARVYVQHEAASLVAATGGGGRWTTPAAEVRVDDGRVSLHCPGELVSRVLLRWDHRLPAGSLVLGDAWERGYGDLQWRHLQPERILPWYFATHDPQTGSTRAVGVGVRPAAMCFWTVDDRGTSLWLDVRSGGLPSRPGDRVLDLAAVVATDSLAGESPMSLLRRHCQRMCPDPRRVSSNVCGSNNWYYAYGHNFDQHQVMRDAVLLAELADGHANRPYCVIDAGWSPGGSCPGGPWTAGLPDKFPDLPGLAGRIAATGVRPGIWMRPASLSIIDDARRLRGGPQPSAEKALDLTLEDNLRLIADDVARIRGWGYSLIKHDFSTWDAFGRWGFDFGAEITDATWHWADRSLTNAEVLLRLYRTIRDAAGDAILIGCNTVGHLAAGLFELQRTGDDTSGRIWERTRKMGVNTLAFRLPQQDTFFQCDADCVASTEYTPWDKDRQFLDLVAASGTPLFVSVDPTKVSADVKSAMTAAMKTALAGGVPGGVEPLDWMQTTCPSAWRIGKKTRHFDWTEPAGSWPMKC